MRLVSVVRVLAHLPLAWLQACGAVVGRLTLALSQGFRTKSLANLAQAGLPARTVIGPAAAHAGRAVAETAWVWFGPPERVDRLTRIEGSEHLERALQQGRGVILLTPHIGAFEVGVRAAARSVPVTVLYKPPRIAALRELVEAGRVTPGIVPVPGTAAGVRSMLRALRRGDAVGVLPDQVPTEGDGVWSPFFGRPAYTMTLPTRLAELTGAQVIVGWAQRLPRARGWVAHFEPLAGAPSPDAINQAMESVIRRLPEQYFWGYNRYKTPPGRAVMDGARSDGGS